MHNSVKFGDEVRYSQKFLRSIGQYTGPMCFAKGRVIATQPFGVDRCLAVIDWQGEDLPRKVLDSNLTVTGSKKALQETYS